MQVQEFYQQNVMPMSEDERLKLAALIINDLSNKSNGEQPKSGKKLSDLFGTWSSGNPNSADNEQIDRDLARAYADNHEDED